MPDRRGRLRGGAAGQVTAASSQAPARPRDLNANHTVPTTPRTTLISAGLNRVMLGSTDLRMEVLEGDPLMALVRGTLGVFGSAPHDPRPVALERRPCTARSPFVLVRGLNLSAMPCREPNPCDQLRIVPDQTG